jgi:hypothetical protein
MQKSKEFQSRHTIYMDFELQFQIQEICSKKNWGFSHACYVLLQQALREKNRKKAKKTESDR